MNCFFNISDILGNESTNPECRNVGSQVLHGIAPIESHSSPSLDSSSDDEEVGLDRDTITRKKRKYDERNYNKRKAKQPSVGSEVFEALGELQRAVGVNIEIRDEAEKSEDEIIVETSLTTTPSFQGRRILSNKEKTSSSLPTVTNKLLQDLQLQQIKLEKRFLQPLLNVLQRQSEILKDVVDKQAKIIRGLRRRNVSVSRHSFSTYLLCLDSS